MLSDKAQKLLQVIEKRGGGAIEEYQLRDGTGLSHGSIVAARRELVATGRLQLSKSCRKLIYTLTGQQMAAVRQGDGLTGQQDMLAPKQAAEPQESGLPRHAARENGGDGLAEKIPAGRGDACSPAGLPALTADCPRQEMAALPEEGVYFAPAMPHVAGTYYDFDEWTDALMNALGDCLDISESLVEEGAYTVYSHDFACEDTYRTENTSDGFVVV